MALTENVVRKSAEESLIRILHVDDDVGFLKVAEQILETNENFRVDIASSVVEAFKKLETCSYDVILSDFQMPEKDGLQFFKELKESGVKTPFILFTGKGREEIAIEALNLGADYYLNKIGGPETVYGEVAFAIRRIVEKRKIERANLEQKKLLGNILESLLYPFYVINPADYTIVVANSASDFGEQPQKSTCHDLVFNSNQPCSGNEHPCPLQEILRTKKPTMVEHIHDDGEKGPRHMEIHAYPILDDYGNVTHMIEACRDITERKQMERMKESLQKKLNTIGGLTQHDVLNKLSTIGGNVYLAKQALANSHEAWKHLSDVESTLGQVNRIFDLANMQAQLALGIEGKTFVNVGNSITEAVKLIPDLHGITVVNNCNDLMLLADSFMKHVFLNLVDNSLKHGEQVSKIRIFYVIEDKEIKLVFEDDGVGIPIAEKEKIFERGVGKDSGYGLYLIREMCEVYGWSIKETGKPGKGAMFIVTIPKLIDQGKANYRFN